MLWLLCTRECFCASHTRDQCDDDDDGVDDSNDNDDYDDDDDDKNKSSLFNLMLWLVWMRECLRAIHTRDIGSAASDNQ